MARRSLPLAAWTAALQIASLVLVQSAAAQLKPFPLSANQRGMVSCLENPAVSYDIFLPPAYSPDGPPLPILYTLHSNGGGMVNAFKTVCSNLNIITVGVVSSKNSVPWNVVLRDFYAVPRDIRQRVLFDPSAVFVGGLSGGAENSYVFSRFWSQHVTGVLAMGGWLGRTGGYATTDRVQAGLLVARTTGTTDTGAAYYLTPDANVLTGYGAVIGDWSFTGGHVTAPDAVKTDCLNWLLSQRIPAGPADQANAAAQAAAWRARIASGQSGPVLQECLATLLNQPRSWFALQAQLVLDDLMTNYPAFRSVQVPSLAQGDFASDLAFYYARGAATNGDWQRYHCALKVLTGISGTSGDRAGDLYYMLTNFQYAAPLVHLDVGVLPGKVSVSLSKDVPALSYAVESRTDLANGAWGSLGALVMDSSAAWSATADWVPGEASRFYRVATAPIPGSSPPWPDNGGYGQ